MFGDGALGDGALGDGAFGDGALGNGALGDGALGDGALGDGALGDGALGDGALGDGALGDGALGDGALGNGALGNGALGNRVFVHAEPPCGTTPEFIHAAMRPDVMTETVVEVSTEDSEPMEVCAVLEAPEIEPARRKKGEEEEEPHGIIKPQNSRLYLNTSPRDVYHDAGKRSWLYK